MALLKPEAISFMARISEDEIRARLVAEVLESIGTPCIDGKPPVGVTSRVTRGEGRVGGYVIEISGPMPARLLLSGGDNGR